MSARQGPPTEVNRGYLPPRDGEHELRRTLPRYLAHPRSAQVVRTALLPVLLLAAVTMLAVIRLRLIGRRTTSTLHADAVDRVSQFIRQYPLHPYPILAKAFELAFLDALLPSLLAEAPTILEVAIGEGSFSARIFPPETSVVGLDIAPGSLVHAASKPHVKRAVICDCLDPPIKSGTFDVLVANNFLHHVSQKSATLGRWALLAERAIFNESTRYWASAWPRPYILDRLGLHQRSEEVTAEIELTHLQALDSMSALDDAVAAHYEELRRASYFSERTFFYCGIVSGLMRCSGPPTPDPHKRLFTGALWWLIEPLTRKLTTALIRFDEFQDRSRDVYVSYFVRSRSWQDPGEREGYLECPNCRGALGADNRCPACGTEYPVMDGMLFLVPRALDQVIGTYSDNVVLSEAEHL